MVLLLTIFVTVSSLQLDPLSLINTISFISFLLTLLLQYLQFLPVLVKTSFVFDASWVLLANWFNKKLITAVLSASWFSISVIQFFRIGQLVWSAESSKNNSRFLKSVT